LEAIKKHRKEQAQQIKEFKLRLENLQNQKDHAHQVPSALLVSFLDCASAAAHPQSDVWSVCVGSKRNKEQD